MALDQRGNEEVLSNISSSISCSNSTAEPEDVQVENSEPPSKMPKIMMEQLGNEEVLANKTLSSISCSNSTAEDEQVENSEPPSKMPKIMLDIKVECESDDGEDVSQAPLSMSCSSQSPSDEGEENQQPYILTMPVPLYRQQLAEEEDNNDSPEHSLSNHQQQQQPGFQMQRFSDDADFMLKHFIQQSDPAENLGPTPEMLYRNDNFGDQMVTSSQQGQISGLDSSLSDAGLTPRKYTKRKCLTIEERRMVVWRHEQGLSSRAIAVELGVGRSQIQNIIKIKDSIKEIFEKCQKEGHAFNKRKRKLKYEELNNRVWEWYCELRREDQARTVTGKMIKDKAVQFGMEMGCTEFTASNGWLHSWLSRNNVKSPGSSNRKQHLESQRPELTDQGVHNALECQPEEKPNLIMINTIQDGYSEPIQVKQESVQSPLESDNPLNCEVSDHATTSNNYKFEQEPPPCTTTMNDSMKGALRVGSTVQECPPSAHEALNHITEAMKYALSHNEIELLELLSQSQVLIEAAIVKNKVKGNIIRRFKAAAASQAND